MRNHNEQEIRQYAGFWMRFAAYMIDGIIMLLAFEVLHVFMVPVLKLLKDTPFSGELFFQYTLMDIVEYILATVYFILMTYFTGATLGKKLLKLKVISVKGDGKLRLFDVIYRETIGRYLSDAFLGIGYIIVAFNDEKKAIQDILCDTRVVEVRKVPQVRNVMRPEANAAPQMTAVPQMVEEPAQNGHSQEEIEKQWKQILNPQTEVTTPPCEEQINEGNS